MVLENRAVGVSITSRVSTEIAQGWPCYNPPHEAPLPKATASGHRQVAKALWRNASTLPKEARLRALRYAKLHAGLARALDENPDLGRDKLGSKAAKQD